MRLFRHRSRFDWELEKMQLLAEAVNNHDQSTGTCLACDLPIRLHPPGRQMSSRPEFCDVARARASGDR